ncbi:Trk-type K+ transport system membrane component [Caldalkalibacillus uzonensis]|uniref:Trk-type K+ transport system membrane component n=1 Tax=Caldalkalibacillus uzonensis TaxID=353224 RepID=A0ABU0CY28_9BACI|nr:Trk-type K+ transport system membrane component [Caldalkalibacillus uzonensis]
MWPDSLSQYVGDPVVNLTISALFIIGGLGFTVLVDIYEKRKWRQLTLHSKVVILTSSILTLSGFIVIFIMESFNPQTFGHLTLAERLWASFFQAVTPRTAGFNTIDTGTMMSTSLLFTIFLMFVGASTGSTGGGIKTNTRCAHHDTQKCCQRGRGCDCP